ncbi:MAG TPA: DUF58 domain-containing protein [Opitutae bacterium]|nr:DUF58 domain-containing protein [Puniceicoccaceae bacterium]HCY58194.1 DUF58 domain-containing protein [Opitutae bacterium]|tara:strand:- start:2719 stop:3627 length:909 start_codon:yes stop_codon:yes gene_type:complete
MSKEAKQPFDLIDRAAVSRFTGDPLIGTFPMEGSVSGHHRSNHKGSSVEFAEYREYSPGEDPRRLDWRVMARTDRLFLKEFEAETNLRCQFSLDCSRSMSFGETGSKFDYGKKIIATLAYLFLLQGDAVGFNLLGSRKRSALTAKRNPVHLQTLLQLVQDAEPNQEQLLIPSLHDLAESVSMRALFVIVSDFLDEPSAIMKAIHHCRDRKHEVVLLHLFDIQELEFIFTHPTCFVDLEDGQSLLTDPSEIRKEYLFQLEKHISFLRSECLEAGSFYYKLTTNIPLSEGLDAFVSNRKSSARR